MGVANHTRVAEFIFLGFLGPPSLQLTLFVTFLTVYLLSLLGNTLIIFIVLMDSTLQTPMYVFLSNLSFLEIWYTTATVPKLLATCLSKVVTISVAGCVTQYYFFFSLGATECILLAVMAYDRYVAICSPLRYSVLMSLQVCRRFSAGSWVGGFAAPLLPTILISHLNFCGPQKINHFFCDSDPIFKLSCSDTFLVEALGYTCSSVVILSSFLLTISSYGNIVATVVRLSSRQARRKTFSTCASHLTVVTIYYGTIIFAYVRPPAKYNFTIGKVISVFYCVITPLVNPLIYTLRNKDVKKAFRKFLARKTFFSNAEGVMLTYLTPLLRPGLPPAARTAWLDRRRRRGTPMEAGNGTLPHDFVLLGFPGPWALQLSLFLLFLVMYVLTIGGNVAILLLVTTSPPLHTPMYFFLANLSFLEIWYTTAAVPKALAVLLGRSRSISFTGCLLQMYLVFSLGCTEYFLLAAMAYDRYLAICYPLHYGAIMSSLLSVQLALGSWACGFLAITVPTALIRRLSFCGPSGINHFFCDIAPWVALACSSTRAVELVSFGIAFVVILSSCVTTLVSYVRIIVTVLRIPSASGRSRAFSTCSSHLTVVLIWYGSTIFLHVRTSIRDALDLSKAIHVLNTVVTPVLNPFIYTLRNKEVRESLLRRRKGP
ncbi:olfactory receptor 6F1 [Ctenodactylus gundi]